MRGEPSLLWPWQNDKLLQDGLDALHGGLREDELQGMSPDSKGVAIAFAGAATGATSPAGKRKSSSPSPPSTPRKRSAADSPGCRRTPDRACKRRGTPATTTTPTKKQKTGHSKATKATLKKPPPTSTKAGSYAGCCIVINGKLTDFSVPHPNCGYNDKGKSLGIKPITENKKARWWKAYHIDPKNKKQAICNLCGKAIIHKGSTSGVSTHLESIHPEVHDFLKYPPQPPMKQKTTKGGEVVDDDKKPPPVQSGIQSYTTRKATKKEKEEAKARALQEQALYFVGDCRPFSDAESDNFRSMLEASAAAFKIDAQYKFSSRAVKDESKFFAKVSREDLQKKVPGKTLTATCDHWTSRAKQNYASLTVHWIDNFQLHNAVLAVYYYEGEGSAANIVEDFISKLEEFEIEDAVRWVVTDTAATMNLFGIKLAEKGKEHLYCLDHCLQLITNIAYNADIFDETVVDDDDKGKGKGSNEKKDEDIDEKDKKAKGVLGKVRKIVNFFNSSTTALKDLRELYVQFPPRGVTLLSAKDFTLLQDVVTRWWSTYITIDRVLHLKDSIKQYEQKKPGAFKKLEESEWDALQELHTLLKPFKSVQKQLEGAKYVTASLVVVLVNIVHDALLAALKDTSINVTVREVAKKMMADFKKRFGEFNPIKFHSNVQRGDRNRQVGIHTAYMFAHALDPRFKGLTVMQSRHYKSNLWGTILDEMVEDEVRRQRQEKQRYEEEKEKAQEEDDEPQEQEGDGGEEDEAASFWKKRNQDSKASKFHMDSRAQITLKMNNELDLYKEAREMKFDTGNMKATDPLDWWRHNAVMYPNVWLLAEQYLAIPATSAPSERAVSTAGNLVTMRRCRLKPDLVQACVFLNENIGLARELMKEGGGFIKKPKQQQD